MNKQVSASTDKEKGDVLNQKPQGYSDLFNYLGETESNLYCWLLTEINLQNLLLTIEQNANTNLENLKEATLILKLLIGAKSTEKSRKNILDSNYSHFLELYYILVGDKKLLRQLEKCGFDYRKIPIMVQKMKNGGDDSLTKIKTETHVFKYASLRDIMRAIIEDHEIEGIPIFSKIKENSEFRFKTEDKYSEDVSDVISYLYHSKKSLTPEIARLGTEKTVQNADAYARKMFEIIENMKETDDLSSVRKTVKALNDKKIPTPNDGKWHNQTVQNLYDRWEKLGLKNTPSLKLK